MDHDDALGASFALLGGKDRQEARRDDKENQGRHAGARCQGRPNMKCRMCSRPLTRVGRLCRECEHEVARLQQGAPALDGVEIIVPESRNTEAAAKRPRLRARNIVVLAFCAGILGAAALRFAFGDEHHAATRSVMLEGAWSAPASASSSEAQRAAVTPR
jgi:hypothetical protein